MKKKLIDETVENLKHLDKESLLIIKSGAEMLKSHDSMDDVFQAEAEKERSENSFYGRKRKGHHQNRCGGSPQNG